MKKIICVIIFALNILTVFSNQTYYWYGAKKIPLTPANKYFVLCKKSSVETKNTTIEWKEAKTYISNAKESLLFSIVDTIQFKELNKFNIAYSIPTYHKDSSTTETYLSHLFYVKLKKEQDFILLQKFAKENNVNIEYNSNYLPRWYVLSCLNTKMNALEMANFFYESGLFEASEPDMWNVKDALCVNDTYFSNQWNLKNTGQYGNAYSSIDIHYCEARSLVPQNSNIIIAVLDQGIQLNHPDIAANIYDNGYDTDSHSSPSVVSGNHGTACAGIIGAISNNNLGISGIASNCKLMSISNTLDGTYASRYNRAEGISYAANHNADIISNSWLSTENLSVIDDAISYALEYGRNGKGCVVVFSTGNNNGDVEYPANSNDDIVTVGALSPCGERKSYTSCDGEYWGSNYGNKLDIMAPGVKIPTTDITGNDGYSDEDYFMLFNGTSSACPHVAAVAGLILSVNPLLTQKEVADIIESTAQKVGGYTYTTHSGRPNGTWNDSVGYGLVDAYAAVVKAKEMHMIQGPEYVCDTTLYHLVRHSFSNETITWSVNNGTLMYPHYSIIGPTNKDSVYVRCERMAAPAKLMDGDDDMSSRDIPGGSVQRLFVAVNNGTSILRDTLVFREPYGQTPAFSASSTGAWYSGQSRTFTITNCTNVPDTALAWTVKKQIQYLNGNPSTTTTNHYMGRSITYSTTVPLFAMCQVTITATNTLKECGEKSVTQSYFVQRNLALLTNTDNDGVLSISLTEENDEDEQLRSPAQLNEGSVYTLELWNSMYGIMRKQAVSSTYEQMDISGMPQGVYVLRLKENGEVIAQTKVLIQ